MCYAIGIALLQAILSYLSVGILMLLMASTMNIVMPRISPAFRFLAVLVAMDLFAFGAIGVVGLVGNLTMPVHNMAIFGTILLGANLVAGFFAAGYKLKTGEFLLSELPQNVAMG